MSHLIFSDKKRLIYSRFYAILFMKKIKRKEETPMKKIICKVEYDTEAATVVAKLTSGEFGDPAGYEETLYVTADGKYFLYVNGGAESIHAKEDIKRMSAAKADEWKAANGF